MTVVAIMQPYLFPYVGYFHLLRACDYFVVFDDVQMPDPGYVNRNRLIVGRVPKWFTLPVKRDSHLSPLANRRYLLDTSWCAKLQRTIEYNYPSHNQLNVSALVELLHPDVHKHFGVVEVNTSTILATLAFLGITPPTIVRSSEICAPMSTPAARLIRITQELGSNEYVNLPGGKSLYNRRQFEDAGVRLGFIVPRPEPYPQRADSFVPWMSILDLIASTDEKRRHAVLDAYSVEFGAESVWDSSAEM
jgi:hypothetical protein